MLKAPMSGAFFIFLLAKIAINESIKTGVTHCSLFE